MKNVVVQILFCTVLLMSCKNKATSLVENAGNYAAYLDEVNLIAFDIEKGVDVIGKDTLSLNEIADAVSFLKLDESILLQMFNLHFFEFGKGYAVSSGAMNTTTPIMLFDDGGEFDKIVVRCGHGPTELPNYLTWTVNNNTKKLVVAHGGEFITYSAKDDNTDKIELSSYAGEITPLNDGSNVGRCSVYGLPDGGMPFLTFFGNNGVIMNQLNGRDNFIDVSKQPNAWPLESYALYHSSSGDAIFQDMFNDTLFVTSGLEDFRPYLHLKRGERVPRKDDSFNGEKKREQIFFEHLLESDRYVILTYTFDQLVHCAVMDKTDGRIISNFAGDPNRTARTNGFMRYKTPRGEYLTVDIVSVSRDKMYCKLSPVDAMKFVDGITEDSNPVILIAKLK